MGERKSDSKDSNSHTESKTAASAEQARAMEPEKMDGLLARGTSASTSWYVNFGTIGSQVGKPVSARTPNSSLYVHDLKVAPEGEPGKANPVPHHFRGVTLASTGSAHVGTYDHPKHRGGIASAAISFGTRPKFDFTITTKPKDVKLAQGEHAALVKLLAGALDEFVDESEAQAVLDRLITSHFGTDEVKAVIKRTDHTLGKPVNTSDLSYGPVAGDRNFRLRVDVPTVVKDKSSSWSTSGGGETVSGKEQTKGATDSIETTTTSGIEAARREAIDTSLRNGLRGLTRRFVSNGLGSEFTSFRETGVDTQNGSTTKLTGSIGGEIDVVPNIPLIGPLVKKLVNPKLKVNIAPDFTGMFSLTGTKKESGAGKQTFQNTDSHEAVDEGEVESLAKSLQANELKSQIEMAVKVSVSKTTGEKESGSRKDTSAVSTSTTVGSVQVISTAVQANLVEE